MNRFIAALVLLFAAAVYCQAAETLELHGQITGGQSLGSGIAGHNPNVPQTLTSPMPYVGRLTYAPELGDARFQFVLDPQGFNVEHVIGRSHSVNFFSSVEQFDGDEVQVDYLPYLSSPVPILNLMLDRATGIGSWKYYEYCGGCRGVLPQATGTITSYRVVPEPGTASSIFLVVLCILRLRRRRAPLPVR
jgi:hypothetical protein